MLPHTLSTYSLQALLDFLLGLLSSHKYLIIFLGAALDFFLPNSGDLVMLVGGWFSNTPEMYLGFVIVVGALGAAVSDNTMYWTGRLGGRRFVNRILKTRIPARFRAASRFRWAESRVRWHGGKMVVLGRLVPGFRGSIPLCAGVVKIRYRRFLAFDILAISIWAVTISTLGYLFGQYWRTILEVLRWAGLAALILIVLYVLYRFYQHRRRHRRMRSRLK
jgi:membrane-associated protein